MASIFIHCRYPVSPLEMTRRTIMSNNKKLSIVLKREVTEVVWVKTASPLVHKKLLLFLR